MSMSQHMYTPEREASFRLFGDPDFAASWPVAYEGAYCYSPKKPFQVRITMRELIDQIIAERA